MIPTEIKVPLDVAAIGTFISAYVGWLPHVAAALSVVWFTLRIYESYLNIQKLKKNA